MDSLATIPTRDEILEQLERMLASPRFRNAPNQAAFLELVVRRAVGGKKTRGQIVAKKLFSKKFVAGVSTDVRVTAANLRKTLSKYTHDDGRDDLVVITLPSPPADETIKLPEGESYTPQFRYNSTHPASIEFKLGGHFLKGTMIADDLRAISHFREAFKMIPNHMEAAVCAMEAMYDLWAWGFDIGEIDQSLKNFLFECSQMLTGAIEDDSKYWRVWALSGADRMYGLQYEDATRAFGKALYLNRSETEFYEPYLEFLVKLDYPDEAVRLACSHYQRNIDDVNAYLLYCRTLFRAKRPREALRIAEEAWQMGRGNYEANRILFACRISQKRYDEALIHLRLVKDVSDRQTFIKLGVAWLGDGRALPDSITQQLILPETNSQAITILESSAELNSQ